MPAKTPDLHGHDGLHTCLRFITDQAPIHLMQQMDHSMETLPTAVRREGLGSRKLL